MDWRSASCALLPRINRSLTIPAVHIPSKLYLGTNNEQSGDIRNTSELDMLRLIAETAAEIASLALFVAMIALWAVGFGMGA